jgi:hypothetical protein
MDFCEFLTKEREKFLNYYLYSTLPSSRTRNTNNKNTKQQHQHQYKYHINMEPIKFSIVSKPNSLNSNKRGAPDKDKEKKEEGVDYVTSISGNVIVRYDISKCNLYSPHATYQFMKHHITSPICSLFRFMLLFIYVVVRVI